MLRLGLSASAVLIVGSTIAIAVVAAVRDDPPMPGAGDQAYVEATAIFEEYADYLERVLRSRTPSPFIVPFAEPRSALPPLRSSTGCGVGSRVTPTNPIPIRKRFKEGEQLIVTFDFVGPQCKNADVAFYGYHAAGSPWYDHWCALTSCPAQIASSFILNDYAELARSDGTIRLEAKPGPWPPPNAFVSPTLDGFVLCYVKVTLNDGAFGGTYYEEIFGTGCVAAPRT